MRGLDEVAHDIANTNGAHDAAPPKSEYSPTTQDDATVRDALADLAHDVVDLKLYARQVQASARVVETADEILGFLLDVRA